jgi:ketosteroid isomerase-like protein
MSDGQGQDEGRKTNAAAPPKSQLALLRARVDALEAGRDVHRRLYSYGPALDYHDEAAFVSGFTEEGAFEVLNNPAFGTVAGREALAKFAARHTQAADRVQKHCLFDTLMEVEGDEATCVSYFARLDLDKDGPAIHVFGRYHDQLVRDEDGRWRFRHRTADVEAVR